MDNEMEKVYAMVQELKTAMMVTRRPDGHLVSRAMATQKRHLGADLWFVAAEGSAKLDEIRADPHVNLSFLNPRTMEWLSISGMAAISKDRSVIHALYAPDWKIWFPDEGDPLHGTKDDPRMTLIGITVHSAVFFDVSAPRSVVLYEMVKGWLTGSIPDVGEIHHVER